MAKHSLSSMTGLILLLVLFFVVRSSTAVSGLGGMVGRRMKVKDVKTNEEVQQLGSYSVEQYNRLQQKGNNNGYGGDLSFQEVVEAERQVVSGIKYYLKIAAAASGGGGAPKTFNAVVVVKPWDHSKELLKFRPHDQPLLIREINASE